MKRNKGYHDMEKALEIHLIDFPYNFSYMLFIYIDRLEHMTNENSQSQCLVFCCIP